MGLKHYLAILVLLILIPSVLATSHYSYEHAEELKPLIDWHDYGPEAFNDAIEQNKPIFMLLTAPSWCYWCQVYESEEYLFNPQVIEKINSEFIPIYVDADQRQDLTRQYLEGGWPSTTIMTPSRERLYGFSGPRPVANMIANLNNAVQHVNTNAFSNKLAYNYRPSNVLVITEQELASFSIRFADYNLRLHDSVNGGFGSGQKFPQGRALDYSLEWYEKTKDQRHLKLVQTTLQNQYTEIDELETNYNLFDPVEGGFHRYGTRPDWTPPHYEKMLYDNARLLRAYYHLLQITPEDALVQEVVEKTVDYIETQWYDSENGGFYGNTDVHGEDDYYGQNPRPSEKPRVEKTKYTDWNSEAIMTYLYLWQNSKDEKYKSMAENSLDFFLSQTKDGVYHYYAPDGTKGVRGSLLDNSYLLLAFVEGYEVLGNEDYLARAEQIADYSLDNLYDWKSTGFFERNSPDTDLYAPGDNVLLDKPGQENGIMAYAMVKLYKQTQNEKYLFAGVKTLSSIINQLGGLDRGYYQIKAAEYIVENNLLSEVVEVQAPESFWLDKLLQESPDPVAVTGFAVSDEGIDTVQGPLLLLMIIALFAGFISFASPCTLPILPAYLAYSFKESDRNLKGMTIAFFFGLTLVFTILGMTATVLGTFLKSHITIFSQVAGIAIMLFGASLLVGKGFAGINIKAKRPTSYLGSFLFGGVLGISWTPCVGPILVAILLLASTTGSVATGGILLFLYGIGLAIPLILISIYIDKINKQGKLWKLLKGKELQFWKVRIHSNTLISGLLFLILGYLIFSGTLFQFNQYVTASGFQKFIYKIEDWLLAWI